MTAGKIITRCCIKGCGASIARNIEVARRLLGVRILNVVGTAGERVSRIRQPNIAVYDELRSIHAAESGRICGYHSRGRCRCLQTLDRIGSARDLLPRPERDQRTLAATPDGDL